ncbi:MAG: hypothetical protein ACSHWN_05490 [Methylophilaceae bacterium]
MTIESKIYKSADIAPFILNQLIEDYVPGDIYGYFLIDGKLVPKSLIARINDYLLDIQFEYGDVWVIEKLLGEELWASLNEDEQSVAGACVLIIIENGYAIPVPDELEHKH